MGGCGMPQEAGAVPAGVPGRAVTTVLAVDDGSANVD